MSEFNKVYILEWVEGFGDEYVEELLGIYSSKEKREEALIVFKNAKNEKGYYCFIEGGKREGTFKRYEVCVDTNFMTKADLACFGLGFIFDPEIISN